jgi:hypothetical protein
MPGFHEPLLSYFDNSKDTAGNILAPKLVKFSTAIPLGVEQYNAACAIEVYPNPASNTVHVKGLLNYLTTWVTVVDVTGRIVNAATMPQGNSEVIIHTDELADGLYVIRIQTDSGIVLRKLQVMH